MARQVFVSSTFGSDKNTGSSLKDAFQTLQYAADQSQPDDTIYVAPGVYKSMAKQVLKITRSGLDKQWIHFKNLESIRPIIYVTNESGITISFASYIQIEGFDFISDPELITRIIKLEQENNLVAKGNGIQIERSRDPNFLSHHIRIKDNYIHDCPGNGIDIASADYLEILFNRIEANGKFSSISNCGIRIQFLTELDKTEVDHVQILYNQITNHRLQGALSKINNSCEENYGASGIAIRNNRFDPIQYNKLAYTQKIKICDNLIYLNGGQAIDIFESNNFFISNNTCYQNNQNPESKCGELQFNKIKDCVVQNNIFYARIGMRGSSVTNYENVKFKNNLYYNTKLFHEGAKDLNEDPMFTMLDHHEGVFDFALRPKSPAINTGVNQGLSTTDFDGMKRVINSYVDIGAKEYTGALPRPRDAAQMKIDKRHMTVSWQASYGQTTGQIIVQNSKGDHFSAKLFDYTGKLVYQTLVVNGAKRSIEFDVSALPSGIYFLIAFSDTEKYSSRYFIKNKFENMYLK